MKALFIIGEYELHDKISKVLSRSDVPFKLIAHGTGTADSVVLDYLGLGDNKKTICISIVNDSNVERVYQLLEYHLTLSKAGKGIAFTIPISGASNTLVKLYSKLATGNDIKTNDNSEGAVKKMDNCQHELIVTIVSRGSFEVVKEAAKSAGARGGTLIHCLGIGGEEAAKFLGISIQPEKDMVFVVVSKEDKESVMKSILSATGMLTDHRGVCFSLPVDSAYGLASKFDFEDIKLK